MAATRKNPTRKTLTHSTPARLLGLAALVTLGLAAPPAAQAQLTTLATFNGTNGAGPGGLTLSGGTLYGTTIIGGVNNLGTVFSIPAGGGPITDLASFNGTNGDYLNADLTLSGGTLYGTASQGGAGYSSGNIGIGAVFSVPVGGGGATALATFSGGNGSNPGAGLTLSADGKTLYGTTALGGSDIHTYAGVVFSVPVGGGTPTAVANFTGPNGYHPSADLTLSADGKTFYGTTTGGGANNDGTVFSVPVGGGALTTLFSFSGANGADPIGGLTLSADGKTLYGTTEYGGVGFTGSFSGDGTVFSLGLAAAPEPSACVTLSLGALSAAGLMLRAHRRKAQAV